MASVTAFEAKTRFGELLERVARGEEVVITRHDKPVARLIPEGSRRTDDDISRNRNPHSHQIVARGFLHEGLSYACRHPALATFSA